MLTEQKGSLPVLQGYDVQPVLDKLFGDIAAVTGGESLCSARCLGCYDTAGKFTLEAIRTGRQPLTTEQWLEVIDELGPYIQTLMLSSTAEPTSITNWPGHQRMIDQALEDGLFVILYTNGLTMNQPMVDWIKARDGLSVNGKWYHPDPKTNDRMMGLKRLEEAYVVRDGQTIPLHLALLLDAGLTERSYRLGAGNTLYQQNADAVPDMWSWLREHHIIPTFSWPVRTGAGAIAARRFGIPPEQLEKLTRRCHEIDGEQGILWELGMGPHIGATACADHWMLFLGPFGDALQCASSRQPPFGNVMDDGGVAELIRRKALYDADLAPMRAGASGRATCVCNECATGIGAPGPLNVVYVNESSNL